MKTHKITGYDIYDYIISGAKRIISHENILNDINVFPIADGDTGSNLTYTMKCIIAKSERSEHLGDTLVSIAKVASEDSFGNSGTIFASYLNGLAQESDCKIDMTTSEFAAASTVATQFAYSSVSIPEEGTMLTIMREWSEYLIRNVNENNDIKLLFTKALQHTHVILENTKTQLAVLRDADVVDAGALGFVYFLEGILDFLDSKTTSIFNKFKYAPSLVHNKINDTTYRYCNEFLVEGLSTESIKHLKKRFKCEMDSVVIQSNNQFTKVHCHSDNPQIVSDFLSDNGKIIKSKIDDMQIQLDITNKPKQAIGIITDTIADIPDEWTKKHQITRIPLQLIVNDNVYVDRFTINSNNLYTLLDNTEKHPTSGQPGEMYIAKTLKFMLSHFDSVIGIFVSSKMSGLFDKIRISAESIDTSRLHIFDSRNNSASQGLMVYDAIQMIHKGMPASEIVNTLNTEFDKYHIHVQIPDLHYATKSGRVPKVIGSIADMFNRKVIISINNTGKGIVCMERSLDQIVKKNS